MKLLVTGGAGFIGGNFIQYLLREHPEEQIVCLDALTYAGNLKTLEDARTNPDFTFIKGDIADAETVDRVFREERPDVVVNFAAESHVDRSIQDPQLFLHTNIIGTGVLLDACRKYSTARFHQISTDEVYGDLPLDRPELSFTETSPLHPSSPYSASKASADLLVLAYHRTFGVPVSISRCSNNYGPYQHPEKLIPLAIRHALENRPIPVYGTGENVRDWIFVEDHCAAVDLILRRGKTGKLHNIGGLQEQSNLSVVKTILEILGKPENLIQFVADRPGHDRRYAIDPKNIEADIGWHPAVRFEEGIRRTVAWYLNHESWWNAGY